ncbi:MAG: hypothetical protein ABJ251_10455 [Paracoccaceae bacterium]
MNFLSKALILATLSLFATAALAVRTTSTMSSVVNPSAKHDVATLINNGDHRIGGGVFFEGVSMFVLEGESDVQLNPLDLSLSYADGVVSLIHDQVSYAYDTHPQLVCPLGRFVRRNGRLAFSIPSDRSESGQNRLTSLGLEPYGLSGIWVAREFKRNAVVALLLGMDYAAIEGLPPGMKADLLSNINSLVGGEVEGLSDDWKSYFNTDSMSQIITFLMPESTSAETSGVPLRFFWKDTAGQTTVTEVAVYSQVLGSETISDLSTLDLPVVRIIQQDEIRSLVSTFNQIDFISAYQTAAIFASVHRNNSESFSDFVNAACRDTRYNRIRR